MSVALSAAVAEVSVALRAGHMITSLRTLDVDLQRRHGITAKLDKKVDLVYFVSTSSGPVGEKSKCVGHRCFSAPHAY